MIRENTLPKRSGVILPIIVLAQFCCTSVWFATNGVIAPLSESFGLGESANGYLTSAIQFGFIIGTLSYALLSLADRYSPSKVFQISALLAALSNFAIQAEFNNLSSLLMLRFFTGFFLAGIYPVGMKIAADHFDKGLGKSLGFLVGALVLGTAFPHLLQGFFANSDWQLVLIVTSGLAVVGGLLMYTLVPDGPYRKGSQKLDLSAALKIFSNPPFRKAAFGYFGHMWELYTFWAFVPALLIFYHQQNGLEQADTPLLSFIIIGIGSLACVAAGYASQKVGAQTTASFALIASASCCLLSPIFIVWANAPVFYGFLIFWGFVVIADSPMLSTLVAKNAIPELKGTALTIVNCIGFAITIVSIQLLSLLASYVSIEYLFVCLAVGPILGTVSLLSRRI